MLKKDPLQSYTRVNITDTDSFINILSGIRRKGYYIGSEDAFDGVGGISAPIKDYQNKVVAALGFTMMLSLLERPGVKEETLKKVQETALAISEDLGYTAS